MVHNQLLVSILRNRNCWSSFPCTGWNSRANYFFFFFFSNGRHHSIDRLEETGVERRGKRSTILFERTRTSRLVHYALLLTPACWKSNKLIQTQDSWLSHLLLRDPTFGIHSHKTLDTAQPCHLLKPNWKPSSSHSISSLTNISTQFLLQSLCVCVCVCVCVWVCVCSAFLFGYFCLFCIMLYVNCFCRTMLYMCIEYI